MSSKPPSAYEVFFGPTNRVVTLKLIRYSIWMVLFPLGTFYFLYYVHFKQDKAMLGWCGMAAVIAANLVIASYVHMAWNEELPDDDSMSGQRNDKKQGQVKVEKRTD